MTGQLLDIHNLEIVLRGKTQGAFPPIVDSVSLPIRQGETLALVGESGSGKSTVALSIVRLLSNALTFGAGSRILLTQKDGTSRELIGASESAMKNVRGKEIAMIFQDPMSSLNPVYSIGTQLLEAINRYSERSYDAPFRRAVELVASLGIPDPERCLRSFPHQLSGGMRQRIMIGVALSCRPGLLIADEPTTALDVTIQAQIVELLKEQQQRTGMSMLFITHNLGLVAQLADRVAVMYAGRVVETAPVHDLFRTPRMPYTQALLRSIPQIRCGEQKLKELPTVKGLVPGLTDRPAGCAFSSRCPFSKKGLCDSMVPPLSRIEEDREVACLRWEEIAENATAWERAIS